MLIVDNMTNREIFNELVNDAPNVTGKVEHVIMKYRREILKRTQFPVVFKAIDYVSPKKNHWFIIFRAFSRKDADAPVITYACTANSKDGFYAFMVSRYNDETAILLFPPHLFHRYRERFLGGDMTLKGTDLIKYFFCGILHFNLTRAWKINESLTRPARTGFVLDLKKRRILSCKERI